MSTQVALNDSKAISDSISWDLEFLKVRISKNVRLIPQEMIENVKGQSYTPEQFYKYQEEQILNGNAGNLLYLLVDEKKTVEGFLWIEVSAFDRTLFVNTFSISKKYWHKGKAIPKVIEHLRAVQKKMESPKVFWITQNDRFFTKHGFKRSKNVLMEYCE